MALTFVFDFMLLDYCFYDSLFLFLETAGFSRELISRGFTASELYATILSIIVKYHDPVSPLQPDVQNEVGKLNQTNEAMVMRRF